MRARGTPEHRVQVGNKRAAQQCQGQCPCQARTLGQQTTCICCACSGIRGCGQALGDPVLGVLLCSSHPAHCPLLPRSLCNLGHCCPSPSRVLPLHSCLHFPSSSSEPAVTFLFPVLRFPSCVSAQPLSAWLNSSWISTLGLLNKCRLVGLSF